MKTITRQNLHNATQAKYGYSRNDCIGVCMEYAILNGFTRRARAIEKIKPYPWVSTIHGIDYCYIGQGNHLRIRVTDKKLRAKIRAGISLNDALNDKNVFVQEYNSYLSFLDGRYGGNPVLETIFDENDEIADTQEYCVYNKTNHTRRLLHVNGQGFLRK